jgi:hypothetical protein
MSVAAIQQAIISIKLLPPKDRIRMYMWAKAEMEPEAVHAAFDQACEAGCYATIIAETDKEYAAGEVLSQLP